MDLKIFFAKNLKAIRKKWGMDTQEKFSVWLTRNYNLTVTRGMISQYENGNSWPGVPLILILQDVVGLNVKEFFAGLIPDEKIPPSPLMTAQDLPPPPENGSQVMEPEEKYYYLPALITEVENILDRLERLEMLAEGKK